MKLTPIRKDPASGDSNCPALYRTEDGGHVVVGRVHEVDAADLKWGLKEGERAVYLPPGVLAE